MSKRYYLVDRQDPAMNDAMVNGMRAICKAKHREAYPNTELATPSSHDGRYTIVPIAGADDEFQEEFMPKNGVLYLGEGELGAAAARNLINNYPGWYLLEPEEA